MRVPSKILENAIYHISQLPGIGKHSALRLSLHMLRRDKQNSHALAEAIKTLVDEINHCVECHNISDSTSCSICSNPARKKNMVCVVEDIRDVLAIENTGQYNGVYHVLGGKISPMDGIGPDDIQCESLIKKAKNSEINEIIFALSSTMEGDTTVFYLFKKIARKGLNISTIARGISVGDEIEYTDEITLGRSIKNRIPYESILKH